ncbi:MAG: CpsB/CapC family capsule biosynthesis tyrosine phosphatase [Peptostreptococcaceae bacterium]
MIDVHCHILPVDDGAKDFEEAIEMAKIAEKDGIKIIINTSHFNDDFDYIRGKQIKTELETFNNMLKENNINVKVMLGNELYYNESLMAHIQKRTVDFYTLANSNYVLLEFCPGMFPKRIDDIVYEFTVRGYRVILAHIERYKEIQQDITILNDAINEGAYVQINASSILKKSPKHINEFCDKLLKEKKVHIVSSDAHGSKNRRPILSEAYDFVLNEYGRDNAEILFNENPLKIINNEKMVSLKNYKKEKINFLMKLIGKR